MFHWLCFDFPLFFSFVIVAKVDENVFASLRRCELRRKHQTKTSEYKEVWRLILDDVISIADSLDVRVTVASDVSYFMIEL